MDGEIRDISSSKDVQLPHHFLEVKVTKVIGEADDQTGSCKAVTLGQVINIRLNSLELEKDDLQLKTGQILNLWVRSGFDEHGTLPYTAGGGTDYDEKYNEVRIVNDSEDGQEIPEAEDERSWLYALAGVMVILVLVVMGVIWKRVGGS